MRVTWDNSPPDGSPGVLLGFILGDAARDWRLRSARSRRAAVLENFASYFGEQARHPTRFIEHDWTSEAYTRGCYGGYLPPGALLRYGASVRQRAGRIHWAGSETSSIWNGYMDGAVRSGERAAHEVLSLR